MQTAAGKRRGLRSNLAGNGKRLSAETAPRGEALGAGHEIVAL
jgi:hypothetical protein